MPGTIIGNMDGDIMSSNQLPGKDIPPTYLVGSIFWFVLVLGFLFVCFVGFF